MTPTSYIRCVDCLSIGSTSEPFSREWHCGICGGQIEFMGTVTLDLKRLEKKEDVAACDKRCTHASGPLCVCKCACKNHGTGRTVKVIRDAGPVPKIEFNEIPEMALQIAELWREKRSTLQGKIDALPYNNYQKYTGRNLMRAAAAARTTKKRNQCLVDLEEMLGTL